MAFEAFSPSVPAVVVTERFAAALSLAIEAHAGQFRKGTQIPYIAHPLAVSSLILAHGGDEDLAIAGLLHDVIEDGGAHYGFIVRDKFGARVSHIVENCTDGVPNAAGVKAPWRERKEKYLAHLREADADTLLVAGCDKLANASDLLEDCRVIGEAVFNRFSVPRYQTLWYYRQVAEIIGERGSPVAARLHDVIAKIEGISARFDSATSASLQPQNRFVRAADV